MQYPGKGQNSLWPKTLMPYVAAVVFESFLYGIYAVLFGTCIFLLIRRGNRSHRVHLASAILMFTLATADVVYTSALLFSESEVGFTYSLLRPKYVLYVTTNFVADAMLIHRFYKIWYPNAYVAFGLAVFLVFTTACGYALETVNIHLTINVGWAYPTTNLVLNIVITSLIVERIWRANRDAAPYQFNKDISRRNKMAVFIFIESGIIYSVYILFQLGFRKFPTAFAILETGFIQIVGIVPTLILVQSGLFNGVRSSESTMVGSVSGFNGVRSIPISPVNIPGYIPCSTESV